MRAYYERPLGRVIHDPVQRSCLGEWFAFDTRATLRPHVHVVMGIVYGAPGHVDRWSVDLA